MYSTTQSPPPPPPPPVQSHHHHLTVPETSHDELNQLSIKSLSDLYLGTGNSSSNPRLSNPFLSTALLNNLRSRLNETSPTGGTSATASSPLASSSSRRGSSGKGYHHHLLHHHRGSGSSGVLKHGKVTPLETLFQPPGDFLSSSKGNLAEETISASGESVKGGVAESRKSSSGSSGSSGAPATRSERLQAWLYAFLNQPSNPLAIFYHLILSLLFVIYIFLVIFTDRTTWHQYCSPDFLSSTNRDLVPTLKTVFERCLLLYFVLFEYVIRLYASRSRPYYVELPWWRYVFRYHYRLAHLFDLIIVCAGVIASSCQVALPLDFTQDVHALIVLRGLHRLFNVAQWSSVKARHSPWALMAEVFQEQGSMLFGIFYLESLVVFFMAYFLFLAETHTREETDKVTIENMVDALYCSSITLLTIGYGDKTPVTLLGKTIVSAGIIIGLGLFGLPAGIIATSLAIKLNEQDQIRSRSERRQAAAVLIQRVWRFQRRLKRFTLASMIIESKHHSGLVLGTSAEGGGGAVGDRARSGSVQSTAFSPFSNLKIDNKLYEKLDYLVSRKTEFLQMQFLDQIRIQQSRRRFTEMLKRHHAAAPSNSSRHLIKQHWIEHRQLTELLETMHDRLDKYAQQIPSYEQSFDLMEEKLIRLQTRMEAQRAILERMNLRP